MTNIFKTFYRVISLLIDYWWGVRVQGWTLIGVDALIDWDRDEPLMRYMSFAPDPYSHQFQDNDEASYFDAFGVEDSDIFYYLDGFRELLRQMLTASHDGWRITHAWLVFIKD